MENEKAKLLEKLQILDSDFEEDYDNITWLASKVCDMPIALISLLDEERQWFKSNIGLNVRQTPIEYAFCSHACSVDENSDLDVYVVENARINNLFKENPLVKGYPSIVFYAGMPIQLNGVVLGTVCVIDNETRDLTIVQKECLRVLSNQVAKLFELRILKFELAKVLK